jgi:tripartite ATP-independent transporter DctM subunit
MPTLAIGVIGIVFLFVLLVLGVHIGLALGVVGFFGIWAVLGSPVPALAGLDSVPYRACASYSLTVVPLFVIMGIFATQAGISRRIYEWVRMWLGRIPGVEGIATVGGCTIFGAVCGSAVATASVFTKIGVPEMLRHGYGKKLSSGIVASSGIIGMLIPPSIYAVLVGAMTGVSIGRLLIAGIVPGLLVAAVFCIYVIVHMSRAGSRNADTTAALERITWRMRIRSLGWPEMWLVVVLFGVIAGGIYGGVFSTTAAGGVAAFVAMLFPLLMRRMSWTSFKGAALETGGVVGMVFIILIGAAIFKNFLLVSGLGSALIAVVASEALPPMAILIIMMVVYLVMGCFLDSISMMAITLPIFFPISETLGWDPIWFCTLVVLNINIGLLTPPLGLNVYTVKAAIGPDVSLEEVFLGIVPFFVLLLGVLALLILFPPLATWLPSTMR